MNDTHLPRRRRRSSPVKSMITYHRQTNSDRTNIALQIAHPTQQLPSGWPSRRASCDQLSDQTLYLFSLVLTLASNSNLKVPVSRSRQSATSLTRGRHTSLGGFPFPYAQGHREAPCCLGTGPGTSSGRCAHMYSSRVKVVSHRDERALLCCAKTPLFGLPFYVVYH
jgi:hypothetical protein